MQMAIEHAGADRGFLVLPTGDGLRIQAEGTADSDRIEVRMRRTAPTETELPVSIIQYVMRTEESVILDDALVHNLFSDDDYLRRKQCRSILCLPLVRRTKLTGVVYLENSLASRAFTPARSSLLKLLASQAAISIENARLYADLLKAEELIRELARVARLTTMAELTASITHEIVQPLSAVVTNSNTCLHWLEEKSFDLAKARSAATRASRDAERTNDIIMRIRALMIRSETQKVETDMNGVIREVLALTNNELLKRQVLVRAELAAALPPVLGDRIQLQQLVLNLIMNGVEAMSSVAGRLKELTINTRMDGTNHVLTLVRDCGVGLDPDKTDQIFNPFFTTKPDGTGMGLAICRSIVETHDGRIWASPAIPHGALFQFTLPTKTISI